MASQQKKKSQKDLNEEDFSCTNQDVLSALLVFNNTKSIQRNLDTEDSSAEEEEELLRQHHQIVAQREFEQRSQHGFVPQEASRSPPQNLRNSDERIVASGSVNLQSSPDKVSNSNVMYDNQMYNIGGSFDYVRANDEDRTPFIQHASLDDNFNMGMMGQQSLSTRESLNKAGRPRSGSKRTRPISAYPIHGQQLLMVGESVESSQALSKFTMNMAKNNQSRKQYIPKNIGALEKEKLYQDQINFKIQRNDISQQNIALKTHLKAVETDLKKKDQIIAKLTQEMRAINSQPQMLSSDGFNQFFPGSGNNLTSPAEFAALGIYPSHSNKQQKAAIKASQQSKQMSDFRRRIKDLKLELLTKETEVHNLQRTLKFTKLKEYEVQLQVYSQEIHRMKKLLIAERQRPRIDPAIYKDTCIQLEQARLAVITLNNQASSQNQDIEKLTQANQLTKVKLQKTKTKFKKTQVIQKRQATKIKLLETKVNDQTMISTLKGRKTKKMSSTTSNFGDQDSFEQLQMQLGVNQILIDKLGSMGIDVGELIRTSQHQRQSEEEYMDRGEGVKNVLFTFTGPEGLIEGGDDQQYEMPIDFNAVSEVDQVKAMLTNELQMDQGIDLVLREKQSGQELLTINDVLIAMNSGDGILVQFIEVTKNEDEEQKETEKYSDEEFDEEEKQVTPRVMRVPVEKVQPAFKDIRLKLMIKKVPHTHMAKYFLENIELKADEETQVQSLTTKQLVSVLETKFNFGGNKALKVARFLIEGPATSDEDAEIEEKDHSLDIETFIKRLREHTEFYNLLNGLAITSMLSRLQGIVDTHAKEFSEDLNLDDEDSNGYLSIDQIWKVWKLAYGYLPKLDEELQEFVEYMALRCSISLKKVNYKDLCLIFDEDYLINESMHEDAQPFACPKDDDDETDLKKIVEDRETRERKAQSIDGSSPGKEGNESDGEIDSDDLMLHIDEALSKIVKCLPPNKTKTALNKQMLPAVVSILNETTKKNVLVIQPQTFIQCLVQSMQISFTEKELYCLLHILVREQDSDDNVLQKGSMQSLSPDGQEQGFILYKDVYTLIRNYLRKEKIMQESIRFGLDYHVLTKPTFDFLLRIKQELNGPDGKTDQNMDFKNVFEKYITTKRINKDTEVLAIEFDNFFDGLFMKFKIMCPPPKSMNELKLLLAVQFGVKSDQSFILVQKMERILHDLDFVYVNLIKVLRAPNAAQQQSEALQRLNERYQFVARSISNALPEPKRSAVAKADVNQKNKQSSDLAIPQEYQAQVANARHVKKPRPMSSKQKRAGGQVPPAQKPQDNYMSQNTAGIEDEIGQANFDDAAEDEIAEEMVGGIKRQRTDAIEEDDFEFEEEENFDKNQAPNNAYADQIVEDEDELVGSDDKDDDEISDNYEIPNDDDSEDSDDMAEDSFDFQKEVDKHKKNAQKTKDEVAMKDEIDDDYSAGSSSVKDGRAIDQLKEVESGSEKYSEPEEDQEGDEFDPDEEIQEMYD